MVLFFFIVPVMINPMNIAVDFGAKDGGVAVGSGDGDGGGDMPGGGLGGGLDGGLGGGNGEGLGGGDGGDGLGSGDGSGLGSGDGSGLGGGDDGLGGGDGSGLGGVDGVGGLGYGDDAFSDYRDRRGGVSYACEDYYSFDDYVMCTENERQAALEEQENGRQKMVMIVGFSVLSLTIVVLCCWLIFRAACRYCLFRLVSRIRGVPTVPARKRRNVRRKPTPKPRNVSFNI